VLAGNVAFASAEKASRTRRLSRESDSVHERMRLLPTMRKGTHAQHKRALRDSGSRGASDKTVDIFTCRQKRQKRKKMDLRFSPKFANQTTPNSGRLSIQLRVRPRILFEYLQRAGFLQHLEGPWRMDHWKWREDCYRRRWSDLFKDFRQSSGNLSLSQLESLYSHATTIFVERCTKNTYPEANFYRIPIAQESGIL